jgi:hypothetical protein
MEGIPLLWFMPRGVFAGGAANHGWARRSAALLFEKRCKNFCDIYGYSDPAITPEYPKVFWFFFAKKNCLPCWGGQPRLRPSLSMGTSTHRRIALPEPVARIYRAVGELEARYEGRKFTPDGHLVGSIGEVIAAEALDLKLGVR